MENNLIKIYYSLENKVTILETTVANKTQRRNNGSFVGS